MFLGLGVGAFSAAVFHLMTHAFFKALLFLGAGAVILALHHEQDMGKMGGLRRDLPIVFWTFLAGSAALAGLPLVTAGFFSKDLILWETWSGPQGSRVLWAAGIVGALLTAIYIFRLVFLVFFGEHRTQVHGHLTWKVHLPLIALAALSIGGGWIEIPPVFGGTPHFSGFLDSVFATRAEDTEHAGEPSGEGAQHPPSEELMIMAIASLASLGGIGLAWLGFGRDAARPGTAAAPAEDRAARVPGIPPALAGFLFRGWDFDRLYDALFVTPFVTLARLGRADVVDLLPRGIAAVVRGANAGVRRSQTGRLRWYAAAIAAGAIVALALVAFA
jgi:NADH-quinone oxidoreductase subunit L